jgi:hypothetical protein
LKAKPSRNKIGRNGANFKCPQDFFQTFCQLSFLLKHY